MAEKTRAERTAAEKAELARIAEEGIWTELEFRGHEDDRLLYLEQHVYPTLMPALKELLAEVSGPEDSVAAELKRARINPIDWLAQYLMRNNPKHNTFLHQHPCALLTRNQVRSVQQKMVAADAAKQS
eukprot:TRINITY_DN32855_c0_g1_i1.p2 TRINITY_DN32855_c0_g1~~TRINITY_DN32855_c0_g1_i1.p2  ORF type:complete len:128 (+),score=46.02 TRINITY_DN32855_c0_g1_i1:43-426(+)